MTSDDASGTDPAAGSVVPVCKNHPSAQAKWQCDRCRSYLCEECTQVRQFTADVELKLCRACGGTCRSVAPPGPEALPKSFFHRFIDVFAYPFRGHGKFLLLAYFLISMVLYAAGLLICAGFVIWAIYLVLNAYITAYMVKIISSSAGGEDEPPDWPDVMDAWDDIIRPCLSIVVPVLVIFIPAILYATTVAPYAFSDEPVFWMLIVLGLLYLPMAWLTVVMFDTFLGVSPTLVIPSIAKVMGPYLVACLMMGAVVVLFYLAGTIPLVFPFVNGTAALYLGMVFMRILGLIYYTNSKQLGWFED